jgi:hypothetical protein
MIGRRADGKGQFFFSFDLDKVVPPDHPVRQIDGMLDLNWVHKELSHSYSHAGRPGADDPDARRWLYVCDPLRATGLR